MEEAKAAQEQHRLAEIAYAKEAAEAKAAQEAADIATANAIREQAEASAAHASWCVELSAKAEADSAYQRAQINALMSANKEEHDKLVAQIKAEHDGAEKLRIAANLAKADAAKARESADGERMGDEAALARSTSLYRLQVIVKEGKNLPNNFGFGKADPMCIVSVNDLQQRTQIISNNLSPVWNKTMNFSVEQSPTLLRFWVYDSDVKTKKTNDILGHADVDIKQFVIDGCSRRPISVPLKKEGKSGTFGTVNIELSVSTLKVLTDAIVDEILNN